MKREEEENKKENPSNKTVVEREGLDDGRITLGALAELVEGELAVVVLVHDGEDLVDALLWCVLVLWQLDHGADHFVDCVHNLLNQKKKKNI